MSSVLSLPSDPFAMPCLVLEALPVYLAVCLVFGVAAAGLLFFSKRFLGKAWFYLWDRYIARQRPQLVFHNYLKPIFTSHSPIYGDSRFNFSKASFVLDGLETWNPGLLKVRRLFTLNTEEVKIRGKYRVRGEQKHLTAFNLDSEKMSEHVIEGINNGKDNFVFAIERNASEFVAKK